jgi:hypothetical protein
MSKLTAERGLGGCWARRWYEDLKWASVWGAALGISVKTLVLVVERRLICMQIRKRPLALGLWHCIQLLQIHTSSTLLHTYKDKD